MRYITLTKETIGSEHICCAFSDKKCTESYEQKKQWLSGQFANDYTFQRLDERAKVFIEYGPTEKAWVPVTARNTMMLGCFWVSGKYKKNGHGKALLQEAVDAAKQQGMDGLVAVVGTKKFHFMSDTKWLLRQGFETIESTASGFSLISLSFNDKGQKPCFNDSVTHGETSFKPAEKGITVYFSNRCPYSEYHVKESLVESAKNRDLPLKIIKLESQEQAQASPTPGTIFSLYLDGKFVTTDISACMDKRFDKAVLKLK